MVSQIVMFHERRYQGGRREMRRLVNQAGKEVMPYLFLIQQADILSQSDYRREEKEHRLQMAKQDYEKVCAQGEAVCLKELHVTGKDLIRLGMKAGPELGKMLQRLMDVVLENPDKNKKEMLLAQAKEWIKNNEGR